MAANTDPKVHMGALTGGEGREFYAMNPIMLLPMGSQEDQGPHAPMGDYLLAEKIAELAALRATRTWRTNFCGARSCRSAAPTISDRCRRNRDHTSDADERLADMIDSLQRTALRG